MRFRVPTNAWMKHRAGVLLDSMPIAVSKFVARNAALAPASVKIPVFEWICSRITRNIRVDFLETNMGISSGLRCQVPTTKHEYLFGRPENYIGERSTCELVKRLSADCSHFIDVRANEGLFTFIVYASRGKNITLHFFEPDPTLFDRLSNNLKANNIDAVGNAVAVAQQTGEGIFYRNLDDDSTGSLVEYFVQSHRTKPECVRTISLNDYFTTHQIAKAIVKVDVEGAGSDVWQGSKEAANNIEYLIIEILEPEVTSRLPARIMSETGWNGYYIENFNLRHSVEGKFSYVHPFWNWLFCNRSPSGLAKRLAGTK